MAKFAEIIKKEGERSERSDFLKIYLHAEGKFLHAYDVSAWLYSCHSPETFKLRCQKSKQFPDGRYVVIGHPPTEESFAKYAPKGSTLTQEENLYILNLAEDTFPQEVTTELLLADFHKWKMEQPLSESPTDSTSSDQRISQGANTKESRSVDDVLHQILAYPLESSTLLETLQFVSDLKKQVAHLIE